MKHSQLITDSKSIFHNNINNINYNKDIDMKKRVDFISYALNSKEEDYTNYALDNKQNTKK
jgi:hypothetical protein